MGDALSVDLAGLRATAAGQSEIAERAMLVAAELKAAIESAGAVWGTDKPGKIFEEFYLPSSEQAIEALNQMVTALDELGSGLTGAAGSFATTDIDSGGHIARNDPYARHPAAAQQWPPTESGPAAVPHRFVPADDPAAYSPSADPDQQTAKQLSASAPESSSDRGATATNPDSARQSDPGDLPRSQVPDPAVPRTPDVAQAGQAPAPSPASASRQLPAGQTREQPAATRAGSPASTLPGTTGRGGTTTPWTGGLPRDVGGPPARPVSAPPSQSPGAAGSEPPMRPMPPRPVPPRKAEQTASGRPGQRPGRDSVAAEPEKARAVPRPGPAPVRTTDPEVLRIAGEMAARHGLTLVGFETAGIGEQMVRELATALDQVLTTHHLLDLRVVEIVDSLDGPATSIRWDHVGGDGGPVAQTARLVLDRVKIAGPPPGSTDVAPALAPGSIHTVVIGELGRALDTMGGHAARRKVQRTLLRHYLENVDLPGAPRTLARVVADYRWWRDTLPGSGPGEFDPSAVLVEAFAEVVTGSARAGGVSVPLHRLLVEAATEPR